MNKNDILNTFKKVNLFSSLVDCIENDSAWGEMYLANLESMGFKSEMDLILYVRNH